MRCGRPRKIGPRFPSGQLRQETRDQSGLAAVYILEISDGLVKIGFSEHPERRSLDLDRSYKGSALICCFWLKTEQAKRLEKRIHQKFKSKSFHASGEKYFLDVETAVAMIKQMLKGRNVAITGLESLTKEENPSKNVSWIVRAQMGFTANRRN